MIELKRSLVEFWALRKIDKNGNIIVFPTVDAEQINRCRVWSDYLTSCSTNKLTPSRKEFERMYKPTPDDVA
jgi:hypothetical protein